MSTEQRVFDDWLDLWEELHEAGVASSSDEFLAKYVTDPGLGKSGFVRLRDDIDSLLAADRKIETFLPVEETNLVTPSFLRENGISDIETNKTEHLFCRLAPDVEIIPDYTLRRRLGRGGFGEVWLASGPGGYSAAMKFIPRVGTDTVERASLEVVREIHHPNLIPIFGAWETEDFFVIAMAPADETIMDRYRSAHASGRTGLSVDELLEPFRDVAKTLDYLNGVDPRSESNRPSIAHGDVKPQNILLSGGSVWIGDLGLACVINLKEPTKHSGI